MKPVEFEGQNFVLGRGQQEYMELPAFRCNDDCVTIWSCWELDDADIEDLVRNRKVWLGQLTFGNLFQPQKVTPVMPGDVSMAVYKALKEDK